MLHHLHPIDEKNGFTSEIFLSEVEERYARPVRNVLTAGSTFRVVQRDRNEPDRYYLHGELYKALARIRARAVLANERAKIAWGGPLDQSIPAIADGRPAACPAVDGSRAASPIPLTRNCCHNSAKA